MKRLNTYVSPYEKIEQHDIILLIDTFRATTTINALFHLSAKEVLVTDDIYKSLELKKDGYILCGERGSKKIEGFDYSNSPTEIFNSREIFNNRKVLVNTTNGAKTFKIVNKISDVIALGLVNLKVVENEMSNYNDIGIVCSGLHGNYSLEDHYTAYRIIQKISKRFDSKNDGTLMTENIYFSKDIIEKANHYFNLKKLKLDKDIDFCLNENKFSTCPYSDKNSNIFKMI
ncbi:MAG: 2-phosphosulfolactate phosphatase [Thermotogota bacterium]